MILATCQCQHILCIHYWVEPSLLLSSFLFVSQKIKCAFFSRHFPFPFLKLMIKDCYFLFVSPNRKHNAPSAGIWERMWVPNCPFQAICDQKCDNHSVVFYHFFSVQGHVEKWSDNILTSKGGPVYENVKCPFSYGRPPYWSCVIWTWQVVSPSV